MVLRVWLLACREQDQISNMKVSTLIALALLACRYAGAVAAALPVSVCLTGSAWPLMSTCPSCWCPSTRPSEATTPTLQEYIARFGHGSAKLARQAQSKEKTLEKMVRPCRCRPVCFHRIVAPCWPLP